MRQTVSKTELIEINREIDKISDIIDSCDENNEEDKELIKYCLDKLNALDLKLKKAKETNTYQIKRQHLTLIK